MRYPIGLMAFCLAYSAAHPEVRPEHERAILNTIPFELVSQQTPRG
ncbi:MAG: hypothetical protein VXY07_04555 [Planctomycetota bacterium]|nr:hypothetical protein [Planctomycetota bacterium]